MKISVAFLATSLVAPPVFNLPLVEPLGLSLTPPVLPLITTPSVLLSVFWTYYKFKLIMAYTSSNTSSRTLDNFQANNILYTILSNPGAIIIFDK